MAKQSKLITIAIHTYEKAVILKTLLEKEGIETVLHNVNLIQPVISSGVRVRIHEEDLPLALKIIESSSILKHDEDELSRSTTVFIPVDFSEYSLKACRVGFNLAHRFGGDVILFHTYIGFQLFPLESDEYEKIPKVVVGHAEISKKANEEMDAFKAKIDKCIADGEMPKVEYSSIVTEGVPENEIINYSKELSPAIIVMGTRGVSKKEADLVGSVTAEVLDDCKFPVFTVPENMDVTQAQKIKNVVFFSNLAQQDLLSFDVFAKIFNYNGLTVTIIPIVEKREIEVVESLEMMLNYCKRHYLLYDFKSMYISDNDFLNQFDNYVKKENVGLIVVPNKKRNIFSRLFRPSMAHKMLFHSDTAMLVVPV